MSPAEQYVIDEKGNKIAIILPLTEYQHLREDLHDLAMVAERRDEGTLSLAELKKRVM
jgi:PHD/YefM family antitoxin component YafN of YafNO toxin-antitoxin module